MKCFPVTFFLAVMATMATSHAVPAQNATIVIDAKAKGTPFPHYWEQMFGSGTASLALRDDYRRDLEQVKKATGLGYIRFHGIFDHDVGVYHVDKDGTRSYNFSYVDQIYDGLLERGVKPFVELSFMPPEMSSSTDTFQTFWNRPNISPPRDYAEWNAMVTAFAKHLVDRYGIDEVARWYFEVWNEPNGFWAGVPVQATYFTLYDNTARAIKQASPRLRVGGPATARADMVTTFLKHTHDNHIPVDFLSTHVYGDDVAATVLHTSEAVSRKDMVCRAVDQVHRQIKASPYPSIPFIMSEYNASWDTLPNVTDSVYMGPWLANTISQCAGKVDVMSYWAFSDVFEENGVVRTPFYGGYGLMAAYRIPKPAFNAFSMLHGLGTTRLPVADENVLATRRDDGTLVLAVWHYAPPVANGHAYVAGAPTGTPRHVSLRLHGLAAGATAHATRLDGDHGNVIATFDRMGRPAYPSREQIVELRKAGALGSPDAVPMDDGVLSVDIPPQGLVLLEIR